MLKAIIVDDETSSRNVLRDYITKYCSDVQVLAEANSVQTATSSPVLTKALETAQNNVSL